jgi:phosphoglycerate dehydrogenase-like enzyme
LSAPEPLIVVEDDAFTRLLQIVLDPRAGEERCAAFADFMAHDEPDFAGWCERLRKRVPKLYPAQVRLVSSQEELRAHAAEACALVVESLQVGREEIASARRLKAVQKFGAILRNIDTAACAEAGVKVLTLRRRANISCAEHAFALMLTLARKTHQLNGVVTVGRLEAAGFSYRPFDRRHTPNGNWGRIPGLRVLNGSTLGIIGLGEIGREIALRAAAFGMRILYFQRTRLAEADERHLQAHYLPLDRLLAESDWIIPQLPSGTETRHLLDRDRLAQVKPGASIVNVSRADVVERDALIDALASGRLTGFALDPLYEAPARNDDELLRLPNVVMVPHLAGSPRKNGLDDFEEMILGLAREVA